MPPRPHCRRRAAWDKEFASPPQGAHPRLAAHGDADARVASATCRRRSTRSRRSEQRAHRPARAAGIHGSEAVDGLIGLCRIHRRCRPALRSRLGALARLYHGEKPWDLKSGGAPARTTAARTSNPSNGRPPRADPRGHRAGLRHDRPDRRPALLETLAKNRLPRDPSSNSQGLIRCSRPSARPSPDAGQLPCCSTTARDAKRPVRPADAIVTRRLPKRSPTRPCPSASPCSPIGRRKRTRPPRPARPSRLRQ